MEKVIFDTNAYRNLVAHKTFEEVNSLIENLKEKEVRNGIQSLFSPIVAQELLAHLADPNDGAYDRCLRANKAMFLHSGDPQTCPVFPGFEMLLAKIYFQKIPQKRAETSQAILQMSYQFATNPSPVTFQTLNNNLQISKMHVEQGEVGFTEALYDMVRLYEPDETCWQIYKKDKIKRKKLLDEIRSEKTSIAIAAGFLVSTLAVLEQNGHTVQILEPELMEMARHLIGVFPEPVSLFKQVIENLVNSEFNITEASRANFVWDIALMFCCGKNSIGGEKLYFVTADKAMIKAATQNNSNCYVYTLNEYLEFLGEN